MNYNESDGSSENPGHLPKYSYGLIDHEFDI